VRRVFNAPIGTAMQRHRSIGFHLSAVFCFFCLLVIVLGLFAITRLSDFNELSADIAERWLPKTRILGDLNNFTSDVRAAEGDDLLSANSPDAARAVGDIEQLDQSILRAQRSYERFPHDGAEGLLYTQFKERWRAYRSKAGEVLALVRADRRGDALVAYTTSSRAAYGAVSDTLGQLTDRTVANASASSSRVAAVYRQAIWLIGVAMAVAGVMVAGARLYVRRSISDPLLHLAGCMRRLAADDTDIDIDILGQERSDEIGEMARASVVFRSNAIELMMSQQGLAQQASMLEEKLAVEQRLTQLQRNFVSMASHEFRTPLTIIDGHAQRLGRANERVGASDVVERAAKIRAAVLRMTHLMDALLGSSRVIDGDTGLYFHPAEIDIVATLREVCQLHREISPNVQILEDFRVCSVPLVGDPKLLHQVFSNLLSNAIKYSPGRGLIKMSAAIELDRVAVTVADRGLGIPAADIERLFERHYRGSNVSGIVGTGLGLYLVRMLVDLHDGIIKVESSVDEGSRFTVSLPIRRSAQAEETPSSSSKPAPFGKERRIEEPLSA
jgi:two-component system OmpR family sensor kinase